MSQAHDTAKHVENSPQTSRQNSEEEPVTWASLGLSELLCKACEKLNWKEPSKIQREAIPVALQGKDIIGLAETGSGKTAAFALPILQALTANPQKSFALVLTPTRELAFQISKQIEELGADIHGLLCSVIVGGMDMMSQALILGKKPHIIIATPGRILEHLEKTKGFHLKNLKYLVMDEADRILNMDFEVEVNKILKIIPKERKTFLFSATMTKKVKKLQKVCLKDPVRIEVSTKYQTVEKLEQFILPTPPIHKEVYLYYVLKDLSGKCAIVFCTTCNTTLRITLLLRNLGLTAVPLYGKMSQKKRLETLQKFRGKNRSILVTTDVASRGLDIPHVDVVINFDIPAHSKDYIHRVGRTARAGRSGQAITFVNPLEIDLCQEIENRIGKPLPTYRIPSEEEIAAVEEEIAEPRQRMKTELKLLAEKKVNKRKKDDADDDEDDFDELDDTEDATGVRQRLKGKKKRGPKE